MANNWEASFSPDGFVPATSNHPDRGVVENRDYLAFDADTTETCYSRAIMVPTSAAAGTLKVDIVFAMSSAVSGTVEFEVGVEAITDGDHDLDAGSYFAAVSSGSVTVPATAGNSDTITITPSGDAFAAGDLIRISLARDADDVTNDTATGDARVFVVRLYEEA